MSADNPAWETRVWPVGWFGIAGKTWVEWFIEKVILRTGNLESSTTPIFPIQVTFSSFKPVIDCRRHEIPVLERWGLDTPTYSI